MTLTLPNFAATLDPSRLPAEPVAGLYVHIPFCFHKCHYCDFYSITRQTPERMARFVDLMLREADRWADTSSAPRTDLSTIFFGGGTPSLLPLPDMHRLILGLRDRFDCSRVIEWTIEANPATVTEDYCHMLRDVGVNRLSFGAQSFDRAELATLERHHDPDDLSRTVDIARRCGFENLNMDLIYAIPGQSLASWSTSLETALAFQTPHLSCYGLTYESNTPMAVKKRLGHFRATDEEIELAMLHHTRQRLAATGRSPYEISNYALPNRECRHNLLYWTGGNYIGLGPSAASHIAGNRWRNRPHLGEWEQAIDQHQLPATELEILSPLRRAGELTMLMLRLADGLTFDFFTDRTGYDAHELYADPLQRLSKLALIAVDDHGFRLTEAGINVADAVAAEFLLD